MQAQSAEYYMNAIENLFMREDTEGIESRGSGRGAGRWDQRQRDMQIS